MAINQDLYSRASPYFDTEIVGNKYLDVLDFRPIPRSPNDATMTISEVYQFRPDLLAHDLYGNAKLWWVFAARNPNRLGKDPYFDFKTGTKIFVPDQSVLEEVLGI